ncbi:MAG: hypothetical protein ACXQTS_03735, partial [Candidatus Methanospirareceae archaeon]
AQIRVKNIGEAPGVIYVSMAELDADGNVIDEFVSEVASDGAINPGECGVVYASQPDRTASIGLDPTCTGMGTFTINKPEGTYYYGIMVWSEHEAKPTSYAAATAALGGGSMPVTYETEEVEGKEEKKGKGILKCLMPRLFGEKGLFMRVSCIRGVIAKEREFGLDCVMPRVACLMELIKGRKEEKEGEGGEEARLGGFRQGRKVRKTRQVKFNPVGATLKEKPRVTVRVAPRGIEKKVPEVPEVPKEEPVSDALVESILSNFRSEPAGHSVFDELKRAS